MVDKMIMDLEKMKEDLNNSFDRSRRLSMLTTKLEDVIIYINVFKDKL